MSGSTRNTFLYRRRYRPYSYPFRRRVALGSRLSATICSARLRRIYARALALILPFSSFYQIK